MKSPSVCRSLTYLTLIYFALTLAVLTVLAPREALAWGGYGAAAHGWGHPGGWHGLGRSGGSLGWRSGRFGFYRRPVGNFPYPYLFLGNSGYDPGCIWVRQLVSTEYGPQWQVTAACAYGN
jgi:hypothetical protein